MKSKRLLATILSLTFALCTLSACGDASVPGQKNDKIMEEAPDKLVLVDDEMKKSAEDVTAITAATSPDGKVTDSTGITDKAGHKIYSTGQTDEQGQTIYTTGKKDSNGNILYTKNVVDSFGNLIYYSGKYDSNSKLVLTATSESPDYTTDKTPVSPNIKSALTTSTTLGAKSTAKFDITDATLSYIKYFGGSGVDSFKDIEACSDGGYVAVCQTMSTDGDLSNSDASWTGIKTAVVKYSADGSVAWKYVLGGNNYVNYDNVTVLKDDTIIVAGYTAATDGDAKCNAKSLSGAIARFKKDGTLMWTYSFPNDGKTTGEFIECVEATSDGGFIVGGKAESTSGFFKDAASTGSTAFIFKFDKNCNVVWRKTLHGSKSNTISAISVNDNDEIFATCTTTSYDDDFSGISSSCTVGENTVLLSLDKDGNLKWAEYLQGSGDSIFNGVAATADGGCVVAGYFTINKKVSGIYTQSMGESDGYILKYNSSGKVEWSKLLGGYKNDSISSVSVVDGGYVVTGQTESNTGDFQGQAIGGKTDGFVAYINEKGQTAAIVMLNGKNDENVIGSTVLTDGNVVVCGTTQSSDSTFSASKASNQAKAFVGSYKAVTQAKSQ